MNVYLDDLRKCPEGYVLAKTYEDAVKLIENNSINILSLDHDLGMNSNGDLNKTGYDLVKYICENNVFINTIYIHTDNVVGRENMYQTLLGAKRRGFISDKCKIYNFPIVNNIY